MIESRYWKKDFLIFIRKYKKTSNPKRFSEKLLVEFEKDLMICAFMLRALIERNRFSSKVTKRSLKVYRYACLKSVNNWNFTDIEDLYDLKNENITHMKLLDVCNQLIHSGAIFAYRDESRNWDGVYVCSDYERNKFIFRISLSEIIAVLKIAHRDYPETIHMNYCDRKKDYLITTN